MRTARGIPARGLIAHTSRNLLRTCVVALGWLLASAAWAQSVDLAVASSGPDATTAGSNVAYAITVTNLGTVGSRPRNRSLGQ